MEARESASVHYVADGRPISPSRNNDSALCTPNKVTFDTREIGSNVNQRKPYNAKFKFFTKPLGPGHYDPTCELTKPKHQGAGWGADRSP